MSANRIDGKAVSKKVRERLIEETKEFTAQTGIVPGLAVVLVGEDPGSIAYVRQKEKACEQLGFFSVKYNLPVTVSQQELLDLVEQLNCDEKIHGVLVQLPLPKHIDERAVISAISQKKDVDAFHPYSVGRIMVGDYDFLPCTPAGIMELLDSEKIEIDGKNCVVVGRSNIVGKPMAMLLMHRNGTVTVCHSHTKNLAEICKTADILIAAVGKTAMITADMVKPGAVVIDVGTNRGEDGKLHGDVDFESVSQVAGYITPVPGGVGPMTVTMLMQNTLTAAKKMQKKA